MKAGVYLIRCDANARVYLGQSANISLRWRQHSRRLDRGVHKNAALQADWRTHGPGRFRFEVVASIPDTRERAAVEEAALGVLIGPGCYNVVVCGPPSRLGTKMPPEAVARIADKIRGRVKSDEERAKLSAAHLGRKATPEARANMRLARARTPSSAMLGRHHTEEANEKNRAAHLGRKDSDDTLARKRAAQQERRRKEGWPR